MGLSVALHLVLAAGLVRLLRQPSGADPERILQVSLMDPGTAGDDQPPQARPAVEQSPPETASGASLPPIRPRPASSAGSRPGPPAEPVPAETPVTEMPPQEQKPAKLELTPSMFQLSHEVLSASVDMPLEEKVAHDDVEGMLTAWVEDMKAAKDVDQGHYDPGLMAMRNDVEAQWHPGFDQIQGGPLQEAGGKLLKSWKKNAELYGKTGSPVPDPAGPYQPGDQKTSPSIIDVKDQMDETGSFTKRVVMGVTIHFDGEGNWQFGAIESSGHQQFDEAALTAIEQALDAPDAVLPDDPMKTRWAMEADFMVQPPLPVAGFSFDLALQHFEVGYPLKKKVKWRMKLVAVHQTEKIEKDVP